MVNVSSFHRNLVSEFVSLCFCIACLFSFGKNDVIVFLRKSVNWMMGSIYAGYITEAKELERDAGETSDPPRS